MAVYATHMHQQGSTVSAGWEITQGKVSTIPGKRNWTSRMCTCLLGCCTRSQLDHGNALAVSKNKGKLQDWEDKVSGKSKTLEY